MRLKDVAPLGEVTLQIIALSGDSLFVERLQEMGLSEGQLIRLLGRLPLGGPWLLQCRSSFLALREEEAAVLEVQVSA